MARPKNQGLRRIEILQSAKNAIASRGLTGLRLKDVAEYSSLTPAAIAYYYPQLADLIREVHEDVGRRFYWSRVSEAKKSVDPREVLRKVIRSGIPQSRDDFDFQVLNEMHVHAFRDQFHADLMSDLFEREVSLYLGVIEKGIERGVFSDTMSPLNVARNLVALEDAYGVHLLGGSNLDADDIYSLIIAAAESMTNSSLS